MRRRARHRASSTLTRRHRIWSIVSRGKRSRGWLNPCGRRHSPPASSMPRHSMQESAIFIVRQNPMACSATPFSRDWQQSQRIYLGRAPMAATSNRERAVKVVLVVLGLFTVVANVYPLVTSFLAGLRPTAGTTAPMFWTMYATLGLFLVLAARNPSAHRSLIAFAAWSSVAHAAVMVLMAKGLRAASTKKRPSVAYMVQNIGAVVPAVGRRPA